MGNSGSGKDSIISGAIKNYPTNLKKIHVPKRFITRPSSKFEKNVFISTERFKEMEQKGKFALKWHIYGLDYGVPIEIDEWLKKGHPVAVNVSRTIIDETCKEYKNIKVIFIEVPFDLTVKRMKERGRESKERLKERIERARTNQKLPEADFIVDNSGNLEDAIEQFLNILVKVVRENK